MPLSAWRQMWLVTSPAARDHVPIDVLLMAPVTENRVSSAR
jgi:hypothetical protein